MKHRTLRCAAETLVLLLIAAMAVFLAAGLHQRAPDGTLSTLSTGWYQLTDGVRREVTLPAALETGPGQTITLYNDTLTDSDGGKVLSARGVEYGIEIRAGETLLYRYEDNAFPKNAQMKGRLWADTELPYGIGGQTTLECRARIGELAARNYRQIVFICGINDIGHGYTKEEIVQNYAAMIETVQASNPDCQFVILSTLPTTSAFYSGQQGKITLLNLAFKRFANKTPNVTFVDAYSAFCPKAGEYAYPELLSDGLHPNAEGYAKIAEILMPYLLPEAE